MAKTEVIEFSLYGGEVKVKFYPNSHMYKVTDPKYGLVDQRVKGVTTYLGIKDKSQALVSWATETAGMHLLDLLENGEAITAEHIAKSMGLHQEKKEEAADIGTKTHEWCEYFIKHKLGLPGYETAPVLPEEQTTLLGVNSFLDLITEKHVQFLASERIVYSRQFQYIGTLDFEAIVDGVYTIGDFKTANGLYNSVLAQMAAYQYAAEEEEEFLKTGKKYENRLAVRLAKETEEEYAQRMFKKNAVKALQGKTNGEIKEYQSLEYKMSVGREEYDRDMLGFIHHKNLFEWDNATDFYKNK
jgi:hypothetical protein